ncbi:hypothetical protein [Streptomyces virginiae]|uniref:hypothetical protein n=1 Tax=Streptomyces virginiae TaxID=1961 RepID=UPI002DDC07BD|nr:hypothetical protein [Streptomyces virginiae]WSC74988.1 hypothetical protein OHA56_00850 [Streptomyces virginiae]
MTSPEAQGPESSPTHRRTKPVEPMRRQPATESRTRLPGLSRPRMQIRNRQTAALTFRADEWAPAKAAAQALVVVRGWSCAGVDEQDMEAAVRLLVTAAVRDGGRRVSVHLADQAEKILVVALSHQPGAAPEGAVFAALTALATVDSCGDDLADDGRRLWALLDAAPRPRRPPRAP